MYGMYPASRPKLGRAALGIRDDGIAAITAISLFTVFSRICTTAKSRLRADIINWLDFTFTPSILLIDSTRLKIDHSIDFKVYSCRYWPGFPETTMVESSHF